MNKKDSTKKVEKKEVSKEKTTKTLVKEKATNKKVVAKTNKKTPAKKVNDSFFASVVKEVKKVRWPLKKEMLKYSIATLSFIIFFALYFILSDSIIAVIKTWV